MKALGDYLHENGLKFATYNCAGNRICVGYPGGRGHKFQDACTYASWDVDYLKYDWWNHETTDVRETYKTMRDALHAAGRPIVFTRDEAAEMRVDWRRLHFLRGIYRMRDLWKGSDIGTTKDSYPARVEAHDACLFKLCIN